MILSLHQGQTALASLISMEIRFVWCTVKGQRARTSPGLWLCMPARRRGGGPGQTVVMKE